MADEMETVLSFDEVKHGEPVIVRAYHGTNYGDMIGERGFDVPETEQNPLRDAIQAKFKKREGRDKQGFLGGGVYFTDNKREAGKYGTSMEVEVRLNKPYVISHGYIDDLRNLDLDELRREGYDGIIVQSGRYGLRGESYRQGVAFNPQQVSVAREKFYPDKLQVGARVTKPDGEKGIVQKIREWRGNPPKYIKVKWNKSGVDWNVPIESVEVIKPRTIRRVNRHLGSARRDLPAVQYLE